MILHETLTSDLIAAGARFIHEMNKAGVPILMAVWKRKYDYDTDRQGPWELFLAVPLTEAGYDEWRNRQHKIWSVYQNHRQKLFPLNWTGIVLPLPGHDMFSQFKEAVKSCHDKSLEMDYSSQWADGLIFGDYFIYIPKKVGAGAG